MSSRKPLGIVVVHYGDCGPTNRCLKALDADTSLVERCVLVADASGNLRAGQLPGDYELLDCSDNPGFGGAANRGVEALRRQGPFAGYVILNHDAVLESGYLGTAYGALEPGVGLVIGPIRRDDRDGELWYSGGRVNMWTGTVVQSRSENLARVAREVGFAPGCALVLSAEAWNAVGGFDERFFLYNEDTDLCLRLRRSGFRLVFEPELRCVHLVGKSTGSDELSPLYLENLTATRLLPFPSRAHRIYLAALHSGYVIWRSGALLWRFRGSAGARVAALLRGHARALKTVL